MRLSSRAALAIVAAAALSTTLAATSPAVAHPAHPTPAQRLPLGRSDLPESRTVQQLAPGLTLTTISRGRLNPATDFWTIGVNLPVGEVAADPDPDADQGSLAPLATARAVAAQIRQAPLVAAQLAADGFAPRIEPVDWAPALPGYAGGLIGYTLRLGRFGTAPTAADPLFAALTASHFKPFAVFTGQDGRPDNTGPWVVRALQVDPHRFHGRITSTLGDAVSGQETTSAMAQKSGAIYATNGGFFTISPADGTPGVPAGLSVVNGVVETAATNGRVALVLGDSGRAPRIETLSSDYTVTVGGLTHRLDGLNRAPGVIRNCGGVGGDLPTQRPVQDFTCTDPDELVALTPAYGTSPSTGPGLEVLVDAHGTVTAARPRTGAAIPAGDTVLQAIGTDATWLARHATIGARVRLSTAVRDGHHRLVHFSASDSVVNGGPRLLHDGRIAVDIDAEGMVHEDPALGLPSSGLGASWAYSWVVRDNPRTGAGIDAQSRLLLVQVDGRQDAVSEGLGIRDFAAVLKSLGAVEAINLDGGGSSATVINGRLVSAPSDVNAAGQHVERADGDAIVVLPQHQ
jgi:hypothetical protein